MWAVEKYGSVNGDVIFYRKLRALMHHKFGANVLPGHGSTPGALRTGRVALKPSGPASAPLSHTLVCHRRLGQDLQEQIRERPPQERRGMRRVMPHPARVSSPRVRTA